MELPEALEKLGELKGKVGPLEAEVTTLRGHKERLETDLSKAKTAKQTAESRVSELEGQLPGDGSLVLGKDDAKRWAALSDLEVDGARGDAAKIAERLTQAATDRATALQVGNEKALAVLGLRPDVLELKKFDGAVFTASKEGDKVTATVKQGDKDVPYETWVKDQGLETTLKNFAAAPLGVQVLGQVTGEKAGPVSRVKQYIEEQKKPKE